MARKPADTGNDLARRPPSQSNWNHIFAVTRGFVLSVFAVAAINNATQYDSFCPENNSSSTSRDFFGLLKLWITGLAGVAAAILFSFCKVGNGVIYHLSNVRKVRINHADCVS